MVYIDYAKQVMSTHVHKTEYKNNNIKALVISPLGAFLRNVHVQDIFCV